MMKIGNRQIGDNQPCFIIAELSANHLHNFDIAIKTLEAAAAAGVDAFKIQTLTADTMTINCDNEYFTINKGTLWDGRTLYDLYSETPLPYEWHQPIIDKCHELGLIWFSTPYDKTATDFLETLDPPAYKIASFEITDIPLIEYVASKGKPVIMSTGIATKEEIENAIVACRKSGNHQIALLKCTSAYPAPYEEINLRMIEEYKREYRVISGLSDHTLGTEVPVASVALGASIIEKHMILDRNLGGPDAAFSLEPEEFKTLVNQVRNVEKAIGTVTYELSEKVKANRMFARSLFVVKDIKKGEPFTEESVRSIRPGDGLAPKFYHAVLGKHAAADINRGTPLNENHIEDF
ncbi:MAG: pseudaminic acid synthase [Balneolaceae bacterium]|nr:MAG: pseudaminic acid synthase [Balneolaceae bacterium]